jgi:hypothetical protein
VTINDILSQLQELGFTGAQQGFRGAGRITQGQIANVMAPLYGLEAEDDVSSAMFSRITPSMLSSTLQKTYSPFIESKSGSLLSDLLRSSGGKGARTAAGGFAGSGGFGQFLGQAKDVYGKGMADVMTQVGLKKAHGVKAIQDVIGSWHENLQSIAANPAQQG